MKHLRRLALSRIRDDAVLSRQHWTASGGWRRRILRAASWYLILPVSAILIGFLVAFLGAVLGSGNLAADPAAAYTLVVAGIATVVSFTHTGWVLRELIGSRSLAVASVQPDSDRSYATGRLVISLQKTLLFLAGSLLLGGGIAFGAELNVLETVQVLLLSVLLWATVASLSVIMPAFLPGLVRKETASFGGFMMLIVTGAVLDTLGIVRQGTLIFAALATLPTGWPILMIKYGVILKQPEYWWLLIPAGAVLALAAYSWFRLLARYRIQEFSYEPGSMAIAEFDLVQNSISDVEESVPHASEASFESTSESPPNARSWLRIQNPLIRRWLSIPDPEESSVELTRDESIARICESGLTKRFAWSESGFIERAMARILGDDELLAADILSTGEPKWSVAMTRTLVPASAAVMLVVLAALLIDRKIAVISGHVVLGGLIGTFAGSRLASQWRSDSGEMCSALALLPIDAGRVSRMLMTLGAIRSLLIFPLAAGVVMAITWGRSGRVEVLDSAIFGGKAVLVLFMIHQWWFLIMQPFSHSKSVVKSIGDIFAAILIIGEVIAGVCMLLMSGRSEIWSMAGAGLMFGGGWLVQNIQRRRILTSPTDFVLQMQTQRVAVQRQQQSKQTRRVPTFWPRPVEQPELSP
ncbi:MAG: hypothetical protein ACKVHE_00560 [Planctomycetales bacterium]|jgi:hypothetical protein